MFDRVPASDLIPRDIHSPIHNLPLSQRVPSGCQRYSKGIFARETSCHIHRLDNDSLKNNKNLNGLSLLGFLQCN